VTPEQQLLRDIRAEIKKLPDERRLNILAIKI
jgi:hypothetical protein